MPFKIHRFIPTTESEIEFLLEIPLLQNAVTATAPGLHPPLGTIAEDPGSFGLVQISNNLKEVEKKQVKHCSEVAKKYKNTRDITHNIYLVLVGSVCWSWVAGSKSWVVGSKSWVVGPKSWVVGSNSWVVSSKSWVVGRGLLIGRDLHCAKTVFRDPFRFKTNSFKSTTTNNTRVNSRETYSILHTIDQNSGICITKSN